MRNICTTGEYKEGLNGNPSIYYTAVCGCGDPAHSKILELEFDDNGIEIQLNLHYELNTDTYHWHTNPFQKIWNRIKFATKVLLKGRIEVNGDFLFHGEEQIEDYIIALNEGKKKLAKWKKEIAKQAEGNK